MPRLIVRMHEHLTPKATYWRSGVIVEIDGNRVLVRGDSPAGRIFLAVFDAPLGRRSALTVVRSQLRAIHRTIPQLLVKEMVPLPGDPGLTVEYEHLLRLESRGVDEFLPQGATREYRVRTLLNGIEAFRLEEQMRQRPRGRERRVFLSYAWGGESEETTNAVEKALVDKGIKIVRDKREIGFKGSIRDFMSDLGRGEAIVVVLSDKYLKSKFCMFELCEIFDNRQFKERTFPIVLDDAKIYDALDLLAYVRFWQDKRDQLNEAIQGIGELAHLQGIREDLDLYDRIRDWIARLTDALRDMNTYDLRKHRESEFADLLQAIERRLLD